MRQELGIVLVAQQEGIHGYQSQTAELEETLKAKEAVKG